ncbi:MAG: hypothetical protein HY565_05880 [Candidatus Kerfeldbacteria bacterium]|nr:hypothetical protein [Candidatus Kerfeldbacteria bacterium]
MKTLLYNIVLSIALVVVAPAALATTDTITQDFAGDSDSIVLQSRVRHDKPQMASAYISDDGQSIIIAAYRNATDGWSEPVTQTVDPLEGASYVEIDNLRIKALARFWVIYAIARHLDSDGNFVAASYEAFTVNRNGYESGTLTGSDADIDPVVTDESDIAFDIFPSHNTGSDSFWILWGQDGELHLTDWISTSSDHQAISLAEAADLAQPYVMLPTIVYPNVLTNGPRYLVGTTDTGLHVAIHRPGSLLAILVDVDDTAGATVLDARWGNDDIIHVLYELDGSVYATRVNVDADTHSDPIELFSSDSVSASDVSATYNRYGNGQYLVTWRAQNGSSYTFETRLWRGGSNRWATTETLFSTTDADIALPTVYPYHNGRLQLIWENGAGELKWKRYNSGTQEWGATETLETVYGNLTLDEPLDCLANQPKKLYVCSFTNNTNDKTEMHPWVIGNEDSLQAGLELPTGYDLITQQLASYYRDTDNRNWYFALVHKDDRLKTMIGLKTELFQ